MGWLFGKKKLVPRIPFPEARPLGEGALRLPNRISPEKVFEPEKFKAAAGFNQFPPFPEEEDLGEAQGLLSEPFPPTAAGLPKPSPLTSLKSVGPAVKESEPLFIKVEVYQRVLGELEDIKMKINNLYTVNRHLDSSEYNEENNFEKMKKAVKNIHDKLLQIDKITFKA